MIFFVENPDGSWMWRQRRPDLSWSSVLRRPGVDDFRTDFCRFGTKWRKRTRFRTNSHLGGQKLFCICKGHHLVLRGRCKQRKMNMTKLAEPYPRGLCNMLAGAIARDAGFLGRTPKAGRESLRPAVFVPDWGGISPGASSRPGAKAPHPFGRCGASRTCNYSYQSASHAAVFGLV